MDSHAIQRIAQEFWESAGNPEIFPRDLETAVLWGLPVAVFKLPRLWVSDVRAWLASHSLHFPFDASDRPLHGCLIAHGGHGCVLLDGTDNEDELRFSLSHEVSHFILDYLRPRQRAVQRLGDGILEVFDGVRAPSVQERTHAVLAHVPIGFHTHLMGRSDHGLMGCDQTGESEGAADVLAMELLAPAVEVRWQVQSQFPRVMAPTLTEAAVYTLQTDFGLPSGIARGYARYLFPQVGSPSVREWLRPR
jgi:hypothetical protein